MTVYRGTIIALLALFLMSGVSCLGVSDAVDSRKPTRQERSVATGAGGVLRLYEADPSTLDPGLVGDVGSYQYIGQIFSGLVTVDDKLEVAPDIASKWEISSDGRTYTFTLRRDVKFHDGTPVTAKDFKYSFERTTDPKLKSQVAAVYLGDIVGVDDKLSGKALEISGVQVKDDYTLILRIDAPRTYFLSKLTYPTAFVLLKSNVEGGKNWW